jgi:hypothetical protein
MFSFFGKRKNPAATDVPAWADFLSPVEYFLFTATVLKYFARQKVKASINDGLVILPKDSPFEMNMGLTNLAQLCHQSAQAEWMTLVTSHFETGKRARQEEKLLAAKLNDLDYSMPLLSVRIYSADYIENVGFEYVVSRPLAEDIHAVLVFDLPSSIQNLQPNQAEAWGFSNDELFDIAIRQTSNKYSYHLSEQPLKDEKLWFVGGEHFFTASILMEMEKYPQLLGVHGSLVALPNRHAAIFYPIESTGLVYAINQLLPITIGMYGEGPGSLSDQLYLMRENAMTRIPYELSNGQLKVYPSEELASLLSVLGADSIED